MRRYSHGEINVLIDHRGMVDSSDEMAVYSPEVAERAVIFQEQLINYSKKVVALCNSEFMVQQLNHVAQTSGNIEKATHLFENHMVERAYCLLDINGNDLIKSDAK